MRFYFVLFCRKYFLALFLNQILPDILDRSAVHLFRERGFGIRLPLAAAFRSSILHSRRFHVPLVYSPSNSIVALLHRLHKRKSHCERHLIPAARPFCSICRGASIGVILLRFVRQILDVRVERVDRSDRLKIDDRQVFREDPFII